MTVVLIICGVMLSAAALLVLVRVERGPSMLDRMVALDVLTAVIIAALAIVSAVRQRTDLVPLLVVLALVGFVGSVALSRFAASDPPPVEEADAERDDAVKAHLAQFDERRRAEKRDARRRAGPEGVAGE